MQVTLDIYFFIGTTLVLLGAYFMFKKYIHQKLYYKKVVDRSANIVMFVNQAEMIEVNNTFFKYFSSFRDLEEFSKKHKCVCEFFEKEEDYLEQTEDGQMWVNYLVNNQEKQHKAKIRIGEEVYYFLAAASKIDERKGIFSVILSDITEQVKAKKELMLLTLNDTLTNIGNRRFFDQKMKEHITLSERYNTPFSLMILDIDFFKKINDRYGHDVGDQVLIDFTKLIKSSLREGDIFARIGGEEFAILLPLTTNDKAYILAQKLRELVEKSGGETPITMSVGLVQHEKGDDDKLMFKRADAVLYKAKETGRNKVILG